MPALKIDTTALEQLEELVHSYDADLNFSTACRTCWSGQLRLALPDPTGAPSRSITFFSTGGADPEQVAAALLADAEAWLAESGVEPTSVPDWMLQD
jgi:hypothetical protein